MPCAHCEYGPLWASTCVDCLCLSCTEVNPTQLFSKLHILPASCTCHNSCDLVQQRAILRQPVLRLLVTFCKKFFLYVQNQFVSLAGSGAMGMRTAHQVDAKAQLVVCTFSTVAGNSADYGEDAEALDTMRLGKDAEPSELKGLCSKSDVLSTPRLVDDSWGGPWGACSRQCCCAGHNRLRGHLRR